MTDLPAEGEAPPPHHPAPAGGGGARGDLDRFLAKLKVTTAGCHEFQGARSNRGYGRFQAGGKLWLAHRFAWEAQRGPIPEGMFVCHHCDNPPCCNLQHLFLGTHTDNMADLFRKNETCLRGHPWTPENTMWQPGKGRKCRECKNLLYRQRTRR